MRERKLTEREQTAWLRVSQPRLRLGGLVALLLVTSLVSPLSLDMYTPAIPHMADYFATDEGTVNLTLTGYYLFFATGMLLFGPLSDKYGRKPIMLAGLALYAVGSVACAVAPSAYALVGARVVQALGALLVTAGQTGPLAFCVIFSLFAIAEAAARPYTMNILLEQQARNAGAASALLNFVRTGIGCIGMGLTALPWTNHAFGIGVLMIAAMAAALIGWIALMRSSIPLARVKNARPTRVL